MEATISVLNISGVNMKKVVRNLVLAVGISTLWGCSMSGGLKPEQQSSMTPYKTALQSACVKSPKMASKYSDKDIKTLCESEAERAVDDMKTYFLLYNEDKIIAECKSENKDKELNCLRGKQKVYYSSITRDLIKKNYSE
jgi:hypothetical protein